MTSRNSAPLLLALLAAQLPACAVAYYDSTESDGGSPSFSAEGRQTAQEETSSPATDVEELGTGGNDSEDAPNSETEGEDDGGTTAVGGSSSTGGMAATGGDSATGGTTSTGGDAPTSDCDSAVQQDSAQCGTIVEYQGATYVCISQASGVNGETTGCGVPGVYCSTIDPTDASWGSTAWAQAECP